MKLRTRLHFLSTTSIAIALIVSAAIYWASAMVSTSIQRERYGLGLVAVVSDIKAGLRAVMSYEKSADIARWRDAHAQLVVELSQPPTLSNEQRTLLRSMEVSTKGLLVLFEHLVNVKPEPVIGMPSGRVDSHPESGLKWASIRRHLEERLYAQMDMIVEDSLTLTRIAQEEMRGHIANALVGVVLLVFTVAIAMTLVALHMGKHIRVAIERMTVGMKGVANGQMNAKVIVAGDDEISQLASDFNRMTEQLFEATAARDFLRYEAEERTRELVESHRDLEQSEHRFRALFDYMSNCVAVFETRDQGRHFSFKDINRAAESKGGMKRAEVLGCRLEAVFGRVETNRLAALFRSVWSTGDSSSISLEHLHISNKSLWLDGHVYKLPSGEIVLVYEDVTEKKKVEDRLRLAATVFENTTEGVIITDSDSVIVEVNRAFTDITQYTREEALGKKVSMLKSGRHDEFFYQKIWASIKQCGMWRGEIWDRKKDGTVYPEWLNISEVKNEAQRVTHYVAVFTDISVIKRSQERLDYLAHHDPLTGLPNRLLFDAMLKQSLNHARRNKTGVAVVFIDLDRFKNINDSLGHPAGDELLKGLAGRLTKTLRQEDTIARISGDEFIVLLEEVEQVEDAEVAIEKLMTAFRSPFKLQGHDVRVTASMGVSLYPRDGEEPSELIKNADAAMYLAKDEGRNSCKFYTQELTRNAFEQVLLESALRGAMDRGEFTLAYQPQVSIDSCRLTGMEALLRWHSPDFGMVSPAIFIPLAEANGLINDIGLWVLNAACTQAKDWLDSGLEFGRVSVNIAGSQIIREGFTNSVTDVLENCGLPADRLELEVTEGFIMQDIKHAIAQLNTLRTAGVRLAIDDFGTGYSSLSYLKQLPVHRLKIDGSFVRDIPNDIDDMAIAEAVIALGHALDLTVIAEGVETEEQLEFLKERGCHEAQGYLFSKAIDAEGMGALLQNEKSTFTIVNG